MILIDTDAALARALDQPLDPDLKRLLAHRRDQFRSPTTPLETVARFAIVEPSDTAMSAQADFGMTFMSNLVDNSTFGDPDFAPSSEWMLDHGRWIETVFILSDDGFADVLWVPNSDSIDADLIALFRAFATPARERGRPTVA